MRNSNWGESTVLGRGEPPTPPTMLAPATALRILCRRTGGTLSQATFYRWLIAGKIRSIRLGKRIWVPLPALEELIRQCWSEG